MQIDSAHLRHPAAAAPSVPPRAAAPKPERPAGGAGARADTLERDVPQAPPPEVLAQLSAAARCAEELARTHRELHFRKDEYSSRIIIEVRDMAGNVLRTIPPSKALDLMTESPGRENQWVA